MCITLFDYINYMLLLTADQLQRTVLILHLHLHLASCEISTWSKNKGDLNLDGATVRSDLKQTLLVQQTLVA